MSESVNATIIRRAAGYHDMAPICYDCAHYQYGEKIRPNRCLLLAVPVNTFGTCRNHTPKKA